MPLCLGLTLNVNFTFTLLQGGRETVIVAEDYESVRVFLRDKLERFGYSVIEAEDGEEAIHKFRENKEKVNLLLLDVISPRKNGTEFYEEIIGIKPGMKTLFLSGFSEDFIHEQWGAEKGLHLISKPVTISELLRNVRKVLDK
jgi:DNA-binding response OmpR family regulator